MQIYDVIALLRECITNKKKKKKKVEGAISPVNMFVPLYCPCPQNLQHHASNIAPKTSYNTI
jgi:hypothetical protein